MRSRLHVFLWKSSWCSLQLNCSLLDVKLRNICMTHGLYIERGNDKLVVDSSLFHDDDKKWEENYG